MTITVIEGQSVIDVAIQQYGTALAAFDLAVNNQINVTDELVPGQQLIIEPSFYTIPEVQNYFGGGKQLIKTGVTKKEKSKLSFVFPYIFPIEL